MEPLILAFVIAVGINVALFIPAFYLKTDKLTDFSYGLSFATVAIVWYALYPGNLLNILFASVVVVWAMRLGIYLVIRIRRIKRDKRFDGVGESFWKFGRFWLLQGVTVWVVMLPTFLVMTKGSSEIAPLTWIGLVFALASVAFEGVADWQKFTFINSQKNKGKWIESGLWKYSRHPNYFGEIMVWTWLYIAAIPYLQGFEFAYALTSPLLIAMLLIFFTGIPKLEEGADERWGDLEEYRRYKKNTSVLIPLPKTKSE